jgi:aspartate/methionine/tyrosine aminotransferase
MTSVTTLARPLAARVEGLPAPAALPPGPPLPAAVLEAACAALDAGKTHYTDRPGILPLREWVSAYLRERYGLDISPDAVTITCGGTEARFVAVKKLAPAGTVVVCPGDAARMAGAAHLCGVTLAAQATEPDAVSALYLTPADPLAVGEPLLAMARERGWWVIWDTSGAPAGDFHPAQDAALAPQTVTLGSLSDYLPGWRVGWMAGSRRAAELRAFKQSMTICSVSISQWAAAGLVEAL